MRQTYRILPVYTGDVSGVCSALYELGGMVVMHDPSGCNSTYNTHDETRWYDRDSLIFLSGLNEPDAVMGSDGRLIEDVVSAAKEFRPLFIALCNSPIPYLTGTDFAGICTVIEHRTGIPCFYIPTNGMHDYVSGAGQAFEKLARTLFGKCKGPEPSKNRNEQFPGRFENRSVNILGMTPLDFPAEGSPGSLSEILRSEGWHVESIWAMDNSLEDLRRAGSAAVNLVVSAAGLRAAKYLRGRFGTPWAAGVPAGGMKGRVLEGLKKAVSEDICGTVFRDDGDSTAPSVVVIGEPVFSCSIAEEYGMRGLQTCVIASTEESEELIRPGDRICIGEEAVEEALKSLCSPKTVVVADPLYRHVIPEGTALKPVPHLAFSGRIYRSRFVDPFRYSFTIQEEADGNE